MFGRETATAVRRAADETSLTAAEIRERLDVAVHLLALIAGAVLAIGVLYAARER